jgi:hypothetical protein
MNKTKIVIQNQYLDNQINIIPSCISNISSLYIEDTFFGVQLNIEVCARIALKQHAPS